ncbi:ABC transporter substrate-binding protein [Aerococcaceae bacterium DSM 111021]|nr:ABC transporter substrate-binding protein [Aerococcaceae bacterium DSM 111021]
MKQSRAFFSKSVWVFLTLLTGCILSGFSSGLSVLAEEASEIVVTDMADREIELNGPAERIVVLQPSNAEILFAIESGDIIVGRGEYVDYPFEEVKDIPQVSTGESINIEEIIALNPDVVIMTTMSQTEDQINQIEAAGIKVVATDASNIEEVYESIDLIGAVVGHKEQAEQLIADMEETFADYSQQADEAGEEGQSIYFEISPLEYGIWTGGQSTFMNEIAEMLNLENIFADVEGWGEVSEEQVLERNPDYIITSTMPIDGFKPVEEILGRDGWDTVSAVKNEHVFLANSDEFTRPSPRLTDAIKTLYDIVYGD